MSFENNQLVPSDSPLLFFEELRKIWDYFFRGALPLVYSKTNAEIFSDLFDKDLHLNIDEQHYLITNSKEGIITLVLKTKAGNYFISADRSKRITETRLIGASGGVYFEYLSSTVCPKTKTINDETRFFDEYGDPCYAVLSTFTGGRLTFEYLIFDGIIRHTTEFFLSENSKRCILYDNCGRRLRILTFDERGFIVLEQVFDKNGLNHTEAEFQLQNLINKYFKGFSLNYFFYKH